MIQMIFEGGYTYAMAEAEFIQILTLAGMGAAFLLIGGGFLMWMIVRVMIKEFTKKKR